MPVFSPSPPPPQKKKCIAILSNFSQVMQWLQETLKTVLRQFWGGGIEGRHKQGLWQEIQKWWLVLFPSFIFFVLFSWPYKLTDRYKSNKLMIFRVGNTWQSITSQELINLWPSTCKCPQERQFPDQWSRWKSKERGTCITEYLPSEENQQQSQTNLDDPWTWKLSHTGLMRALAQPFSFFYWLFTLW